MRELTAALSARGLHPHLERIEQGEALSRGIASGRSLVLLVFPRPDPPRTESEWQAFFAYPDRREELEVSVLLDSVRPDDPSLPEAARLADELVLLLDRLSAAVESDHRLVLLRGARLQLERPTRGMGERPSRSADRDLGLGSPAGRREETLDAPGFGDPVRGPAPRRTRSPRRGRQPAYSIEEEKPARREEGALPPESGSPEAAEVPPARDIRFTTYAPTTIAPRAWATLLAYCHRPSAAQAIEDDRKARLGGAVTRAEAESSQAIAAGAEITVVPEIPGCLFNPPRASILWLEDWHRVEFRFQTLETGAVKGPAATAPASRLSGWVSFYLGPILVSEIPLGLRVVDAAQGSRIPLAAGIGEPDEVRPTTVSPYQAVFVSYSHRDEVIVDRLGNAYKALGLPYLRDVEILRSGEEWNPALLRKIDEADIFQLCWSQTARKSVYVEQEWRHALKRGQASFIRPLYWESPMPDPPPELSGIHFAYYPIG